ncbi:MAG: DUF262 domain-containing protein, partial [Planctomycetes bacterium]|nr:DUF262 domain-containing protein [Planctomycetota bacterium]
RQQHYTGAITTERVAQNSLERWADESESLASSNWDDPNAEHPQILNADSTITPLYIVDGQQRLLTIAIFITAACDSNLLGESHTERIRSQYLIRLLANDLIPVIGYEPHVPSHSYLRTTIYDNAKSEESHTAYTAALEKAKEFFINEISELSRDELEQYIEKVTQSLVFNYQQLPAALNSYMVFETMNNRGRPLTTLELLKNRILSLIPHFPDFSISSQNNLHATINKTWKHIYEWLAKDPSFLLYDDEFLENHFVMFFDNSKRRAADFSIEKYKRELLDSDGRFHYRAARDGRLKPADLEAYVQSLADSVQPWFKIKRHFTSMADLPRQYKQWMALAKHKNSPFDPILMALLQGKYDDYDVLEIIKLIERHNTVVFEFCGCKGATNRKHFRQLANRVYVGEFAPDEVAADFREKTDASITQTKLYESLASCIDKRGRDGGWFGWDQTRYILREYERHIRKDATYNIPSRFPVSRIYPGPQTQNKIWKVKFGGYTESRKQRLANSIGNLVIVDPRTEVKEGSFERKKKYETPDGDHVGLVYGLAAEREIAESDDWGHEEIFNRAIRILDFIERRWDIRIGANNKPTLTDVNFRGPGRGGQVEGAEGE